MGERKGKIGEGRRGRAIQRRRRVGYTHKKKKEIENERDRRLEGEDKDTICSADI